MTSFDHVVEAAVLEGRRSPCCKSKRGAVIFEPSFVAHRVVARGFNARADEVDCVGSSACRAACSKNCEHAEAAALRRFRPSTLPITYELLHAKVVDGELAVSGGPSCWACSKALFVRRSAIVAVWLFHDTGWRRYPTAEFHRLTQLECQLLPTEP